VAVIRVIYAGRIGAYGPRTFDEITLRDPVAMDAAEQLIGERSKGDQLSPVERWDAEVPR
jgi:hypothetical protein